jgi:hypothetical protein
VNIDGVDMGPITSYNFEGLPITNILPVIIIETELVHFSITATTDGNGIINFVPNNYITCQTGTTAQIIPNQGYMTYEVFVDGSNIPLPANNLYNFLPGDVTHTIYATFEPCPTFAVNYIIEGEGHIVHQYTNFYNSGAMDICSGNNPEFDFVPDAGWEIEAVYIDGVLNMIATGGHFMFINLLQNHTIKVVFKLKEFTINATAGTHGSITPSGSITVAYGSTPHFAFIPAQGYEVDEVFVDNVSIPSAAAAGYYDFPPINANHSIYVTFKYTTLYIYSHSSGCSSIEPEGQIPVTYNQHKRFTFVPTEGCHVAMVYIDGVPYPNAIQTGSYEFFYVTQNHEIYVEFESNTYPITAGVEGNGSINHLGVTYVTHGANITYYFSPIPHHKTSKVFIDGYNNVDAVQNGSYTFENVVAPHSINVVFVPITYTIVATAETGGFITPSGNIPVTFGDSKMFTFATVTGYEIDKVFIDNVPNAEAALNGSYIFANVADDHSIRITCKLMKFAIVGKANANGAIEPEGIIEAFYGENVTYTITPDNGYKISYVLVNGTNMGELDTYSFVDIEDNGNIEAFFTLLDPVNINDQTIEGINIYSHSNIVYIVNEKLLPVSDVLIMDMYGRAVWQGKAPEATNTITLNVANGIYTVRVTTEQGFSTTKVAIQK